MKISKTIHSLALRACIFGRGDVSNTSPKRKRVNFFTSSDCGNEFELFDTCGVERGCEPLGSEIALTLIHQRANAR